MLANSQTPTHGASDVSKQARALTGTVTKLLDNFGFIDDSVFFQLSVVKGGDVHVGDKVYCECSYSEHLPFKWNATKVHLVQATGRVSGATQAASPQVATTYLQHRLQQQQQTREEPTTPMAGIGNNYYSSQPANSSFSQLDLTKAQQAVAAAQQLSSYYASGAREGFSQLQYTSTPGSAFVSASLPFTQQIQQNLLSTQPRANQGSQFKSSASRWERDDRSNNDRFRARDNDRNRNSDIRKRDSKDRSVSKDEFGRDLRTTEKAKERERERERERIERERERRLKRSVSPTSSISSQNAVRAVRRRYDPVNIPKLTILKSVLNVYDIKQRYSTSLHVPSDLKEVIINSSFVLNINDVPKPITFRVIETEDKKKKESKKADSPKEKDSDKKEDKAKEDKPKEDKPKEDKPEVIEIDDSNGKTETKEKISVPPSVSSKQTYKYGVKVLLISVPSMSDIFERIFGSDFDAISTGQKSYFLHFNKLLSFLVCRNSNDGFSLIGGKFNAQVDGYLPDSEEPNLIATAIRVVGEQTGMNLSKCGKWRLISTFVFNRDNSVDPTTPYLELTRVFMPDVWSAFDTIYEPLKHIKAVNELETDNEIVLSNEKSENNSDFTSEINSKEANDTHESGAEDAFNVIDEQKVTTDLLPDGSSTPLVEPSSDSAMDLSQTPAVDSDSQQMDAQTTDSSVPIVNSGPNSETPAPDAQLVPSEGASGDSSSVEPTSVANEDSTAATDSVDDQSLRETEISATSVKSGPSGDASELQLLLSRINDMKVAELRAELEKRGVRLKGNLKKADLVTKLRQLITKLLEDEDVVSDEVKNDWWAQRILSKETNNDESVDDDGNKTDEEVIDEEALLKEEDSGSNQVESNDVVMAEKEEDIKDVEVVEEQKESQSEQEMVVDLSDETNEAKSEAQSQNDDSEKTKITENGTVKRKSDSEESPSKETKKVKNGGTVQQVIPTKVTDGCVFVKGTENLTVITLHEALNHQKYDQFEMSIISEVIRESLIHHFSHYILSALVYNHKNPLSKEEKTALESKNPVPVNYVHLSFSYFDSSHCGHLSADDLSKLLSNANFTLSRKSFGVLINNEDKVTYRDLQEPKELLPIKANKLGANVNEGTSKSLGTRIYEREGTVYDIEQLIDQSESDEKIKVRLNEELTADREKINQLNEYIQELEGRQKKMTIATEKQNDEICVYKREREVLKKEYDILRKAMETTYAEYGKILAKNDKKETDGQKTDK